MPQKTCNLNMLAANHEYFRSNRENSLLPIRMQLSKKVKTFGQFFIEVLESTLNFEHFEIKFSVIAEVFLKFERRGCLNEWKVLFLKTLQQSTC